MTRADDGTVLRPRPLRRPTWADLLDGAQRLFVHALPRPWTPGTWGLAAVIVVVGASASLARGPFAGAVDTIWAEDGSVFLTGAERSGLASVVQPYAGYFHLVPRLLAVLASALPLSAAAWALSLSAALVTALLGLVVYRCAEGRFASAWARLLVTAPVVLLPLAQEEILNSIANLQWPGLYALFWVLISVPPGRGQRIVGVLTLTLVALSDILVVAFLPLAVVRLLAVRDTYSRILAGALSVCVVIQVSGLVFGTSTRQVSPDVIRWPLFYVVRAVPAALFGERLAPFQPLGPAVLSRALLAWLCIGVVVMLALRRLTAPDWPLATAAALHSVALYGLPVILSGYATPRYAAAPAMLLLVALAAMLQPDPSRRASGAAHARSAPGRPGAALTVFAVACLVVWAAGFHVAVPRERGPLWSDELSRAEQRCAAGLPVTDIPIAPDDGQWSVHVDCAFLATGPR